MLPAFFENKGILTIIIDTVPAELAKGTKDGRERLALLFPFAMLDGGGMTDAIDAFDADDGADTVEMDPVSPTFAFMGGFKVHLAQCFKQLGDGAGSFRVGNDKLGFHDLVGEWLGGWRTEHCQNQAVRVETELREFLQKGQPACSVRRREANNIPKYIQQSKINYHKS